MKREEISSTRRRGQGKKRERKERGVLAIHITLLYGVNATASPLHLASLGSPSLLLIRLSSRTHDALSPSLSSTFLPKPSFPLLAPLLYSRLSRTSVYTVSSFSFHPLDPLLLFLYRYPPPFPSLSPYFLFFFSATTSSYLLHSSFFFSYLSSPFVALPLSSSLTR